MLSVNNITFAHAVGTTSIFPRTPIQQVIHFQQKPTIHLHFPLPLRPSGYIFYCQGVALLYYWEDLHKTATHGARAYADASRSHNCIWQYSMNCNVQCYFGTYKSWGLQISEGNKCQNNAELEMSIWFQFDLKFSLLAALKVVKITTSNEEKLRQNDIFVSVTRLMHKLLLPQYICYLILCITTWCVLQMTIKNNRPTSGHENRYLNHQISISFGQLV